MNGNGERPAVWIALLGWVLAAAFLAGCGSDNEDGQFTLVQPPPGGEACAYEPEPTPQLDAVKERLEAEGYRVRYSGYSALGYFADEQEEEEVCADSALLVQRQGLGKFTDVTVRQYSDPVTLERTAADLGNQEKVVLIVKDPLIYFYTAPDREKLEEVIAAAEG